MSYRDADQDPPKLRVAPLVLRAPPPTPPMSTAGGRGRSLSRLEADEEVGGEGTVSDSKDAEENEKQINYKCSACKLTHKDPRIFTKINQLWLPKAGLDIWYCPPCIAAHHDRLHSWAPHPGWGPTPQGAAPWEGAAGRRAWLENACAPASASDCLGPEPPQEGVPSQPTTETETITETEPETITETETFDYK